MSTAIVTGAAGGIGAAIVERLAGDGCEVIATDVRAENDVRLPAGVKYVALDLGAPECDLELLFAQLSGRPLDYLVNAAGIALFDDDGSAVEAAEWVWEATLNVNLHGLRHVTTAALPHLRLGEGRSIVNIASVAGLRGMDSPLDAYAVSKAAVVSLSRSLALQFAPEGIRCNTICPGAILTPMIADLYDGAPARRTDMENRTPLRRIGMPADVAGTVAFLLSDDAAFVTAIDLVVDGGWSAQIK